MNTILDKGNSFMESSVDLLVLDSRVIVESAIVDSIKIKNTGQENNSFFRTA